MTDTARYADVVLPAATFLERTELSRGYGAFVLQKADAASAPAGEARPEPRGLRASSAGAPAWRGPATPSTARGDRRRCSSARAAAARGSARDLERDGIAYLAEGVSPVPFVDAFPRTPDGKIHLVPEELDREAPRGLYHYEPDPESGGLPARAHLAGDRSHDQLDARRAPSGRRFRSRCTRTMRESRGVADGDRVRVFNDLGAVRCRAHVDPECGRASCSCRRDSGATTPRAARRPTRSRRTP